MLKIPTKNPAVWTCFLALCAIAIVVTVVLMRIDATRQPSEEENSLMLVENQLSAQHSDLAQVEEPPDSSNVIETNRESVHPSELCKQVFGALSEQCFESLKTYFWDRPHVWEDFAWLPLPLTYRRIFENPKVDRLNVLEALENPMCRLEQGEVRWDLKEECHAESVANYSSFMYFCKDINRKWEVDLDMARNFFHSPSFQPSVYQRYDDWSFEHLSPSSWAGERFLEGRWIVESMCKGIDLTDLDLGEEHYEMLESIGRKLGVKNSGYDRTYKVLNALAARLGDEWASVVYDSPSNSDEWGLHEVEAMPWKSQLREMWRALMDTSVITRKDARTTVLRYGIKVWSELEKAEVEIDLDKLVEYVCGPNWYFSSEDCQDSISALQRSDASLDQSFWHALSKFEARAIKLNLYDFEIKRPNIDWELDAIRAADPDALSRKWTESGNSFDELLPPVQFEEW